MLVIFTSSSKVMVSKPRCVDWARVEDVLQALSSSPNLLANDRGCYVYGMGGQPKALYEGLQTQSGVLVLWFDSIAPKWLRLIPGGVPSHSGLIKITDLSKLEGIFLLVSESSMAGIYFFKNALLEGFLSLVRVNASLAVIDQHVQTDNRCLIYQLDSNNASSETGQFEFLFAGDQCRAEVDAISAILS